MGTFFPQAKESRQHCRHGPLGVAGTASVQTPIPDHGTERIALHHGNADRVGVSFQSKRAGGIGPVETRQQVVPPGRNFLSFHLVG